MVSEESQAPLLQERDQSRVVHGRNYNQSTSLPSSHVHAPGCLPQSSHTGPGVCTLSTSNLNSSQGLLLYCSSANVLNLKFIHWAPSYYSGSSPDITSLEMSSMNTHINIQSTTFCNITIVYFIHSICQYLKISFSFFPDYLLLKSSNNSVALHWFPSALSYLQYHDSTCHKTEAQPRFPACLEE